MIKKENYHVNMKSYGLLESMKTIQPANYARVVSQSGSIYRVVCENGEMCAEISGKMRYEAQSPSDYPVVGDFVLLDRCETGSGNAIIHKLLPRKSVLERRTSGKKISCEQIIAANVDTIFICMSLNSDFSLHRLERYLTQAWESGSVPVIVLTKSDLCDDLPCKLQAAASVAAGVDVLVTSSLKEDGYAKIMPYLKEGHTVVFVGSSGVGKSTLINRLNGQELFTTQEIRKDDKGRHTTTRRELILLPEGGVVIDTPGMREFGVLAASEGLSRSFEDVEEYFEQCRFRDCTHTNEPGCAICAAIECGELSEKRWLSYKRLKREDTYSENREKYLAHKKEKFKNIAKSFKK